MAEAYGLRLTLGGAPDEPHVVEGVQGLYRPSIPTPVGGEGHLSMDEAKQASDDPNVPLELVKIPSGEFELAQEMADAALEEARTGIAQAVRSGPAGFETGRVSDEQRAVAETTTAQEG